MGTPSGEAPRVVVRRPSCERAGPASVPAAVAAPRGRARGLFRPPTVCANARDDARLAREEICRPVRSAGRAKDPGHAAPVKNALSYARARTIFMRAVNHGGRRGNRAVDHPNPER